MFAVLLAACGGGGGSPGLSSGSVSALSVIAPSAVTIQVGSTQQYSIQGGVKPYSIFSSDPAVAAGWLIGENVVSVGTAAAGKATVTIQDAKGSKFDIAVTAGSSLAFFTTAPGTLTMAPGLFPTQTFKLGGGTPPYKAVSNFPLLLSVAVNGTDVTFTALQLPGSATVTLTDSSSPPATFSSVVTLGTIPLAINPTDPTIATGSIFRSVITGGTPPYRTVILDNCLTGAKIVQGNILEAKGNKPCTGSAITVVDANNQSVNLSVTINVGTSVLQLAPSAFTVPESTNTPSLSLLLYGANSGPLQVFSTNTAILAPQTPVSNGDGTYTIALTGGDTCSAVVRAAVVGVDNTVPPNGTFTDTVVVPVTQPTADVAPSPASGGDRTITITVIDSTGRIGTSTLTVKDTDGKAGCT
jgi:hypothetical protein